MNRPTKWPVNSVAVALEHKNTAFEKMGGILAGYASSVLDPDGDGVDRMAAVLAPARKHKRTTFLQTLYLGLLADAYLRAGRHSDAEAALQDALHMMELQNEHIWEPELHRLKGKFALASGADKNAAERHFRTAAIVAENLGAKALRLRASHSLANLLAETDRRTEALNVLASVVGQFSDAVEYEDLGRAQALYTELS